MTADRPTIIVSIPDRTLATTRSEIPTLVAHGADAAEVRFDRWTPDDLARAAELFPAPLPLLATYRSRAEGGEGDDGLAERANVLTRLSEMPFAYLDLELKRDRTLIAQIGSRATHPTLILSAHLRANESGAAVAELLSGHQPAGAIVKVVLPCGVGRFYREVRPLLEPSARAHSDVILTTGPSGSIPRALAPRFGFAIVYAAPPAAELHRRNEAAVEPSQISVDRLKRFYDAAEFGRLLAVTGHPIGHSLSPAVHALWMSEEGKPGLYVALDLESEQEFAEVLGPLGDDGLRGLNVTHPWKETALRLADRAGRAAEQAGCANLLARDGRTWRAENFDVSALVRRLGELREAGAWTGDRLLVIGTGGAARAALVAAAELQVPAEILGRSAGHTARIAREFGAELGRPSSPASLIVHATPAGRADVPRLEVAWEERCGPGTYVLDFVYRPEHPFLRETALQRGGAYEDGSRLLVYQAAESFGVFWDARPSLALEEKALKEVLCTA